MAEHIVINSVPMMGDLVVPAVMHISQTMPDLCITYRSRAELGDPGDPGSIWIRSGAEPMGARLAIRWLGRIGVALVASQGYIARHGTPATAADLGRHALAGNDADDTDTPWSRWLAQNVAAPRIVFRSNDETLLRQAIKTGRCAGFLPISSLVWSGELVELMPAREEWAAALWLVHDRGASVTCRAVGRSLADVMTRQLA